MVKFLNYPFQKLKSIWINTFSARNEWLWALKVAITGSARVTTLWIWITACICCNTIPRSISWVIWDALRVILTLYITFVSSDAIRSGSTVTSILTNQLIGATTSSSSSSSSFIVKDWFWSWGLDWCCSWCTRINSESSWICTFGTILVWLLALSEVEVVVTKCAGITTIRVLRTRLVIAVKIWQAVTWLICIGVGKTLGIIRQLIESTVVAGITIAVLLTVTSVLTDWEGRKTCWGRYFVG